MARRKCLVLLKLAVLAVLLTFNGCQDDDSLFAPPADVEDNIFDHINHYRLLNGYAALDRNTLLDELARSHSSTMIANNSLSHVNQGYRYEQVITELNGNVYAELVARGNINGRDLIDQWSDDTDSNETILGDYSIIGIGVSESSDEQFVTVILTK
ncbi:CAP domain-containing protein [Salinivirga sp.]|uniref:CAP domain-containing protein n=1 Tax=Salinivirga sp. TaxID=1970192 RepID=UPI002B4960C2|nr:CAP domain-containing protein [Salinivirga sp.]